MTLSATEIEDISLFSSTINLCPLARFCSEAVFSSWSPATFHHSSTFDICSLSRFSSGLSVFPAFSVFSVFSLPFSLLLILLNFPRSALSSPEGKVEKMPLLCFLYNCGVISSNHATSSYSQGSIFGPTTYFYYSQNFQLISFDHLIDSLFTMHFGALTL